MRKSYVEWENIQHQKPDIYQKVLVRVEVDGNVSYFEDFLDSNNVWRQALDDSVTHWIIPPKKICKTCGIAS